MPWQGWFTVAVVAGVTLLVARGKLGTELSMFGALSLVVVAGVLDVKAALLGFANPALVTIGILFVVAAALQETGALGLVSRLLLGRTTSPTAGLARIVIPTAAVSGFMNNTPIVAILIPVVRSFAKRIDESPSRFLMPLAHASMLGGTVTLIGTSANLVVSGLLTESGKAEMGMLEISWVGIPTAIVGTLYLLTFGQALLTVRRTSNEAVHDEAREYLAEVEVEDSSPLAGQTIEEAGLRSLPGLFVAEIRRRNGNVIQPVAPHDRLRAGDHLVLTGLADTVRDLRTFPGLNPIGATKLPADMEPRLFEVVLSHRSDLVGHTPRELEFRRRFDAAILAVHRSGERINQKIGDITLQAGDALMLLASPGFRDAWRDSTGFYLISNVAEDASAAPRYRRAPIALVTILGLVLLPVLTGTPMLTAAMAALVILFATRCVSRDNARRAIDWNVLVVIGSALGLAKALEVSGAAEAIGQGVLVAASGLGPIGLLAAVYVMGVVAASLVSNAAGAALIFPIAMTVATEAHLDPRAFAIAVALSASAAFATPVGSNPILLVAGPGGYRYRDFLTVGLPLNALCLVTAMIVIPWAWPLSVPLQ
jgi:di/tricarboxylate transporter